jgi:RNA polymerase sigma-70 factor, ECF subfamily
MVSLDQALTVCGDRDEDLVALDEALGRLAAVDVRKSKVVELRFFGGLSVEETAEALDVSAVTVMREWSMAKAWLYNSLNEA